MTNIVIVVEDGRVVEVLSRSKNVQVEVIDFDTQEDNESKELKHRYEHIKSCKSYSDIL